jgi:hypothetical protein
MVYNPANERVAAVCGRTVSIYDRVSPNGRRELLQLKTFPNYGLARQWAIDYDDRVKASCQRAGAQH